MAATLPSESELTEHVKAVLEGQDLNSVSMKDVRRALEARLKLPEQAMDEHKNLIKAVVEPVIQEMTTPKESVNDATRTSAPAAPAAASTPSKGKKGKGRGEAGPGSTKKRQAELMTRDEFTKVAKSIPVKIGGKEFDVPSRVFSTGSCGYFLNAKAPITVGEQEVTVQCSVTLTIVGSKEWA
eukprot:CAMPEP_0117502920 /NCGR_PEP_ID=MMETSP0784-20121206/24060_1 /TAXON_ID=39447 /ORGANISM="" /LENGTH=182 /DNA_ID=CAMNT_0005298215 /DNA_START=43 /DNA_END=591 /DNA_ORIENTATION=+